MDKEWTYETIYTECQGLGEDEVKRKLEENAWFGGREIAALKWLQTSQRDRAAKEAEEVRQEAVETRKIAQQAKEIAQRANWIALAAVLVSAMTSLLIWWKTRGRGDSAASLRRIGTSSPALAAPRRR